MCTGKDDDFCPEETDEPVAAVPAQAVETPEESHLHRRAFLKAAALGGAAIGSLKLGALPGLAHTDTTSPCTAQDIEVSSGVIVNEPCTCTPGGTFPAVAAFTVTNNNNATRRCITLHMGTGGTLAGQDFLLKDASGSSEISGHGTTKVMFANLGTLPCNFGIQCYPGSVVAFQTSASRECTGPLQQYPGGQCRRQEICIVGFSASLDCNPSTAAIDSNCTVPCGGQITLRASAVGGTAGATNIFSFSIKDPDGTVVGTATGTSPQDITITATKSGTYTLTVTDSKGCTRTATVNLTTSSITASLTGTSVSCTASGAVTLTATSTGTGACTFQFLVDGVEKQAASSTNTFIYRPISLGTLDAANHTVTVNVNCSGCTASDSVTVSTCLSTTVTPN
jgi:hypothetical protein